MCCDCAAPAHNAANDKWSICCHIDFFFIIYIMQSYREPPSGTYKHSDTKIVALYRNCTPNTEEKNIVREQKQIFQNQCQMTCNSSSPHAHVWATTKKTSINDYRTRRGNYNHNKNIIRLVSECSFGARVIRTTASEREQIPPWDRRMFVSIGFFFFSYFGRL